MALKTNPPKFSPIANQAINKVKLPAIRKMIGHTFDSGSHFFKTNLKLILVAG